MNTLSGLLERLRGYFGLRSVHLSRETIPGDFRNEQQLMWWRDIQRKIRELEDQRWIRKRRYFPATLERIRRR